MACPRGDSADNEAARRGAADSLVDWRTDARRFHCHGAADAWADSVCRRRDVVVAAMSRLAWAAAALGATAFLAALAITGGRGGSGLEPFTPKGLMMIPL